MANGSSYIVVPNTAYPTAKVETYNLDSNNQTTTNTTLKFGVDDSENQAFRGLISVKLPEMFDVYGTTTSAFYNTNTPDLTLTDIMIKINPTNAITDIGKYRVYYVKKYHREWKQGVDGSHSSGMPHVTKYIKTNKPAWKHYSITQMQTGSTEDDHADGYLPWEAELGAFETGDIADHTNKDTDQSTDYGLGANGVIHAFNVEDAGVDVDIPLTALLKAQSLTWGDTFSILIKHEGQYALNSTLDTDNPLYQLESLAIETMITCTTVTGISSGHAAVYLTYEEAVPTKPIIELSAGADYITPIVKFSTFPADVDLQTVQLRYNKVSYASIVTGDSGVSLGKFNQESYSDLKGTTFLADSGNPASHTYYLTAIASDNISYVRGNQVNKARMTCSGSLSAGTAIGTELTLTVTGTHGDYGGKFVKFGVNWNGDGTATNDSLSDYSIVTLDEEATSATITHTFDKSIGGNYNVNIFTVDRDGFRSDFTAGDTVNIAAGTPVAKINASRDSLVRGLYGDDFSVCTLSGAHSYAVGSNRKIQNHAFQHNQSTRTTPVSTSPMENDNSNFHTISKQIKLKCNHANCIDTTVKVFGRVSVDSSGGDDPDNAAVFDHYEMQSVTLQPSDSADDGADAGFGSASSEYFKSVDFVAITNLDDEDGAASGTYYTLADSDGNVINNQIRGTPSDYSWGGYAIGVSTGNIAFTAATKRITRSSGSWIADGFAVGDTIYCNGPDVAANNRYFTVNTITATILTVDETVTEDGTDAGVEVYKVNGPTMTFTCMDENGPTITHTVNDTHNTETVDTKTNATASNVTQVVTFESEEYHTLDLDTQADSGNIAILNSQFKRSGGMQGIMALGNRRYPIGTTRTRLGSPALTLSIRVLNQTGYRNLWNLIEGDRYNWATIDSKKVDSPSTAYKQIRMRLVDGTLTKDPSMASQYTASLNFIVIGELVT